MKKTNTTITMEEVQSLSNANVEVAVNNVKKDNKEKQGKKNVALNYDPNAIKISIEKDFMALISEYFAVTSPMLEVYGKVNSNRRIYKKMVEEYTKAESMEKAIEADKNYRKQNALFKHYRKAIDQKLGEICGKIPTSLVEAYDNKLIDNAKFLAEVKAWAEELTGTKLKDDSFPQLVNNAIGRMKTASTSQKCQGIFAANLKDTAFKFMLMDLLTDLAIRKGNISFKVVNMKLEELTTVEEFDGILTVERPTLKTTVKELKDILDYVGKDYSSKAKRADLVEAYNEALKDGLFVEY